MKEKYLFPILAILFLASCYHFDRSNKNASANQILQNPTPTPTIRPVQSNFPTFTQIPTKLPGKESFFAPSPTTITGVPPFYTPNPGMEKIFSVEHENFEQEKVKWIDNDHLAILDPGSKWVRDCQITWDVYGLSGNPAALKDDNKKLFESFPNFCPPYDNFENTIRFIKDHYQINAVSFYLSSNGQFILANEITKSPLVNFQADTQNKKANDGLYEQFWIIDTILKTKKTLLYTVLDYNFQLTSDKKYLILSEIGLGGNRQFGDGLISVNLLNKKTKNFFPDGYNYESEFDLGIKVSPDSQYIIFNIKNYKGTIWTITGSKNYTVCQPGEFIRSSAWSTDSRFAYLACANGKGPDILRRFDTMTKKVDDLTTKESYPFKADYMEPSPDQSRILFRWGDSFVWNHEAYGYWIIDLNKISK